MNTTKPTLLEIGGDLRDSDLRQWLLSPDTAANKRTSRWLEKHVASWDFNQSAPTADACLRLAEQEGLDTDLLADALCRVSEVLRIVHIAAVIKARTVPAVGVEVVLEEPASAGKSGDAASSEATILVCANPWSAMLRNDPKHRRYADPKVLKSLEELANSLGWASTDEPVSTGAATASNSAVNARKKTADSGSDRDAGTLVDKALERGFLDGASDIHFEVDKQGLRVKYRIDGVLREAIAQQGLDLAKRAISRIKVLAGLDITEQRIPQDGRMNFAVCGKSVDLRVSIMPSVHAEDAVLRLLDKSHLSDSKGQVSLESLGFDADTREVLSASCEMPHGMVLVTGPTGSGKTTTLYALLSQLDTSSEKVITIEDPVEYELQGVLQIPVNERKGLTFAKGLRSILRHDPDRILVGEIRDAETAEIAIQSALTGHQVFTTVHANSLFDVLGRFRHFELDVFGFMSALNAVVIQRLLRQLCPQCKAVARLTTREESWLSRHCGQGQKQRAYAPVGCAHCKSTGYVKRVAIAEVHVVDDALRDLVTSGAPVGQIREQRQQAGVLSLDRRAAQMVLEGRTSVDEVRRIIGLN